MEQNFVDLTKTIKIHTRRKKLSKFYEPATNVIIEYDEGKIRDLLIQYTIEILIFSNIRQELHRKAHPLRYFVSIQLYQKKTLNN